MHWLLATINLGQDSSQKSGLPGGLRGHNQPLGSHTLPGFVDEVNTIDPELFYSKYVRSNRPVVVPGAARMQPAMDRWTDDYLAKKAGGHTASVWKWSGGKEPHVPDPVDSTLLKHINFMRAATPTGQAASATSSKCGTISQPETPIGMYMIDHRLPRVLLEDLVLPPFLECQRSSAHDALEATSVPCLDLTC